jgi:hypothetical protein
VIVKEPTQAEGSWIRSRGAALFIAALVAGAPQLSAQDSTVVPRAAQFPDPRHARVTQQKPAAQTANAHVLFNRRVAAGVFAGWGIGLTAYKLRDNPEGEGRRMSRGTDYSPAANTTYLVGSFLGSAAAVYLRGRQDKQGSLLGTLVGTAIASAPLVLARNEPYLPIFGFVIGAPLQSIGGAIGFSK